MNDVGEFGQYVLILVLLLSLVSFFSKFAIPCEIFVNASRHEMGNIYFTD